MFVNDLHSSIPALHIAVRVRVSPLQEDVYTDKQRRDGEPGTVSDLMKYNAIFLRTPFFFHPALVIVLCWRHQTSGSSVYTSLPPHTRIFISRHLFFTVSESTRIGDKFFRKAKFKLSHQRTKDKC